MRLKFRTINRDYVPNVALVDLFPGGFEPVLNPIDAPNVAPTKKGGFGQRLATSAAGPWTTPMCARSAVLYNGTVNAQASEYRYRIRATNAGTFQVPPAYGANRCTSAMAGAVAAGKIVVERAGK